MQHLIEGVHRFRHEEFGSYRSLFQRLSREGQNPHTLFITCSDSRVLAELITQSKPGDLFVVKNIGNIVPPYAATGTTNSTAAAVEFAVEVLRVSDIVICGHSQCGAMAALLEGLPNSERMPHLKDWLKIAAPVREIIQAEYPHITDPEHRNSVAAEENVLFALEALHSYHCVQDRLMDGSLRLHGWFFKIATAELFAYNPEARQFAPLIRDKDAKL
ncbi:MAG TPA: carbonic anhydrase [Verrucomicrobiae bacterium]|jgi:carbonic anhydrase|nr:carbonic anhydrase [Verrucomicrobiae bacterium]